MVANRPQVRFMPFRHKQFIDIPATIAFGKILANFASATKHENMCDKIFSILKDFYLDLVPGIPSTQMFVEDKEGGDMYFTFLIRECEDGQGNFSCDPQEDELHAVFTLDIPSGSATELKEPLRIGTYGLKLENDDENTGLYIVYSVNPIYADGKVIYKTRVQFQIKGGK